MRKHLLDGGSRKISASAFYGVLFAAAFGLNLVWETAQMFAYQTELNEGWLKVFISCTGASVIDAVVTVAIYALSGKHSNNGFIRTFDTAGEFFEAR